jgi:hypothetical protein
VCVVPGFLSCSIAQLFINRTTYSNKMSRTKHRVTNLVINHQTANPLKRRSQLPTLLNQTNSHCPPFLFLTTKKETLLFPFFHFTLTPFFLSHTLTLSPSMAEHEENHEHEERKKLFSSYIGLSFSVFLALLPTNLRQHSQRTIRVEEELRQLKSRRQEDYKANARVAEIFASHRNSWRDEEESGGGRFQGACGGFGA